MKMETLDLKKFLQENNYELKGPYGHQPEDDEIHYNIYDNSKGNSKWIGSLTYPSEKECLLDGKISIHYQSRMSEDKCHEIGAAKITLNTPQIRKVLNFRDFLNDNKILYKEYKDEAVKDLKGIISFIEHTDIPSLEELANKISQP